MLCRLSFQGQFTLRLRLASLGSWAWVASALLSNRKRERQTPAASDRTLFYLFSVFSLSLSVFLSLCFSVSHFFRLSHSLLLPICHFTLVVKEYSIYFSKFNNAPSSLLPGSRVICIFFRQGATSLNSISLGRLVVHFAWKFAHKIFTAEFKDDEKRNARHAGHREFTLCIAVVISTPKPATSSFFVWAANFSRSSVDAAGAVVNRETNPSGGESPEF